jgi:hypothetical protein
MKRPRRDPAREDRIHNEAIVDAGPDEQATSWYSYLEGKITFPFRARCVAANAVSPLRKGETVEVFRASMTCLCKSVGRAGKWPFLSRNWTPSIRMNQPRKPSATGITGSCRVTAFKLRTAAESSRRCARKRMSWNFTSVEISFRKKPSGSLTRLQPHRIPRR